MYTLYGYEGNPRSRIVRIAAAYEGIEIQTSEVIPRQYVNLDAYVAKFPFSRGKVPALEGGPEKVQLTEVMAIAWFIASVKNPSGARLLGDGSAAQHAQVLSWCSWANQELLNTLARWFLPLIPSFKKPAPYDHASVEAGKKASLDMLEQLDAHLASVTYLVGDQLTLADLFIAVFLGRFFEWVLDAEWRAAHPATMKYFEHKVGLDCFKAAVKEFSMVEKETENRNPYA